MSYKKNILSVLLSSTLIPFFCVYSQPGSGDLVGLNSQKKIVSHNTISSPHSQSPLRSTGGSIVSTDEDEEYSQSPQKKRSKGLSVQQVTETPQQNSVRNALDFVSSSAKKIIENIWNLCLRRGENGKSSLGSKDFKSL